MATVRTAGAQVRLYMEVYGQEAMDVALSRFGGVVNDFSPFFSQYLAPTFFDDVQKNFDSEGKAQGGRWQALSPRYAAWKARHFPGKKILERTLRLRQSMRWHGGRFGPGGGRGNVGPGGVFRVSRNVAEMGTAVEYAHWHQTGARATQRGLDDRGRLRSRVSGRFLRRSARPRSVVSGQFLRGLPQRRFLFLRSSQNYGRLMHRFIQDQRVAAGLAGNQFGTGGVSGSGRAFTRQVP